MKIKLRIITIVISLLMLATFTLISKMNRESEKVSRIENIKELNLIFYNKDWSENVNRVLEKYEFLNKDDIISNIKTNVKLRNPNGIDKELNVKDLKVSKSKDGKTYIIECYEGNIFQKRMLTIIELEVYKNKVESIKIEILEGD